MKFCRKTKLCIAPWIVAVSIWSALNVLSSIMNAVNKRSDKENYQACTNTKTRTDIMDLANEVKNEDHDKTDIGSLRDFVVDKLIERLKSESRDFFPDYFFNISMNGLTRRLGREAVQNSKKLSEFAGVNMSDPLPAVNLTYANIRQHALYDPDDVNVDNLMRNMATLPIKSLRIIKQGTQLNLKAYLEDGTKTIMKAMRELRDTEESNNTFYFDFKERHTAEIAAFKLDKVLGFYRVPPTIGRKVNIITEFMPVAEIDFNETVFKSEVNNTCFYGHCQRWCEAPYAFCGNPDIIEVSVMVFLPQYLEHVKLPWKRTYSHRRKAEWETNADFCDEVRKTDVYSSEPVLREAIDAYIFDYMTGNEDRHTFYYHEEFKHLTYSVLRDNGKGFGRYAIDAESNLTPLLQCCLLKKSTVLKFIKLYIGTENVSTLMARALSSDPVAPVLTRGHLQALDRRVIKVLYAMAICIEKHGIDNVIKDELL